MKFQRIRKIKKALTTEINKLTVLESERLVGECRNLTTTNCSWIMYRLKELVIELAQSHCKWLKTQKDLVKESGEPFNSGDDRGD